MLPPRVVQLWNGCPEGICDLHPWRLPTFCCTRLQMTMSTFEVSPTSSRGRPWKVRCKQSLSVLIPCPLPFQAGGGHRRAAAAVWPAFCLREMLLSLPSGRGGIGPSALRGHRHCFWSWQHPPEHHYLWVGFGRGWGPQHSPRWGAAL